jgi:hypothetical protein
LIDAKTHVVTDTETPYHCVGDQLNSKEMPNAKACARFTFRDCHRFSIHTWRDGRARQPGRY